jgi:integrase
MNRPPSGVEGVEWDEYREHLIGQGLDAKTVVTYLRHIARAHDWLWSHHHVSLRTAKPSHIADFSATLTNSHSTRGAAAAAINHYWRMVQRPNPPAKAMRVPPQPEMVCRAVEDDQARALVKTSLGWWPEGTAVLAGLYLALRVSEIARMEWDRFDSPMEWYRVTGKFDKTATLPVHPVLRSELDRPRPARYVFPGRAGVRAYVNPATVWSWCKVVAREAGIEGMTTHRLRHTALTVANDTLGDLRAVQTFARHANPAQTAGYTRTRTDRLRDVSDSLDYLA